MAEPLRALLLHGDEQFLVAQETRDVVSRWKSELVSDFGFEALDSSRLNAPQLRDALLQAPFLDPYRVVLARGIAPARAEGLAAALDAVPDTTRLVITVTGKLAAGNRLVKAVAALPGSQVKEHAALKGRRLNDWAVERAKTMKLSAQAAQAVVRASPPDLAIIDSELTKLAGYAAAGYPLDPGALRELLAGGREEEIFQLTDQIVPRVSADAWRVARNLVQNGMGATTVGYRLARHLALLLEVRSRQETGQDLQRMQSEMREHPFVVQKAYEAARTTTSERLESGLKAILEYEWEVKSGQVDADLGLEVALAKL